jgi:hypothetical protein
LRDARADLNSGATRTSVQPWPGPLDDDAPD